MFPEMLVVLRMNQVFLFRVLVVIFPANRRAERLAIVGDILKGKDHLHPAEALCVAAMHSRGCEASL